ncbi:uncharacterized protein K452DRAFT_237272, partial [Aplosporella prunicola CBS 121167]
MPPQLEIDYLEVIRNAVLNGRLETVKSILLRLPTLRGAARVDFLSQCLIDAVEYGHDDTAEHLLNEGAQVSYARHTDGCTSLHIAAGEGHIKCVQILLSLHESFPNIIEQEDDDGETPWMYAIHSGSTKILQLFLEKSPEINLHRPTKIGLTSAHFAVASGNEDMFYFLREKGVSFTHRGENGIAPIHILLYRFDPRGYEIIVRCLLAKDCDVTINAEMKALTNGHNGVANLIREKLLQRDGATSSPLHYASRQGWVQATQLLIRQGADIECMDEDGYTPLFAAVSANNLDIAKILHQSGATCEVKDLRGWSVIHMAAELNSLELLSYFLQHGLEVNARTYYDSTPLQLAS